MCLNEFSHKVKVYWCSSFRRPADLYAFLFVLSSEKRTTTHKLNLKRELPLHPCPITMSVDTIIFGIVVWEVTKVCGMQPLWFNWQKEIRHIKQYSNCCVRVRLLCWFFHIALCRPRGRSLSYASSSAQFTSSHWLLSIYNLQNLLWSKFCFS